MNPPAKKRAIRKPSAAVVVKRHSYLKFPIGSRIKQHTVICLPLYPADESTQELPGDSTAAANLPITSFSVIALADTSSLFRSVAADWDHCAQVDGINRTAYQPQPVLSSPYLFLTSQGSLVLDPYNHPSQYQGNMSPNTKLPTETSILPTDFHTSLEHVSRENSEQLAAAEVLH
jgi:hypothetical protein